MPLTSPAPEPAHCLGCQREAARCPVSLADMELTDAATQRLWHAADLAGSRPAFALRPVGPTAVS